MANYQNGKIYRLVSSVSTDVYYGSTIDALNKRFSAHKSNYRVYNKDKSMRHYVTSFEVIKHADCEIILVEDFPCTRKDQLHARERYYIENNDCVNKVIPTRTQKEYYEDNRGSICEQQKQYYQDNREAICGRMKEYHQDNRDAIRGRMKEYNQENRESINEKHKAYHKSLSEKITCECGGKFQKYSKIQHEKTKKHQAYLAKENTTDDVDEPATPDID